MRVLGLMLTLSGIMLASITASDASIRAEAGFADSVMQNRPSEQPAWPSGAAGTLASTSSFTVYLPLVADPCRLPADMPLNSAVTREEALLFAGPGNLDYESITSLNACTTVSVQAIYGHFLKVEVPVAGETKIGFVHESSLFSIPANLPTLDLDEVPWRKQDLINHFLLQPDVFVQGNDLVVDNSSHDYYNDDLPISVALDLGFKLSFQLSGDSDQYASVKLADKQYSNASDWWRDIQRVDFATYNHQLKIDLRDGLSELSSTTIELGVADSQLLNVTFLDPFGKVFVVADQNNQEIQRVDVTSLTEVSLPQGLFPDRIAYFGRVAPPHTQLTIKSLALQLAPSGVWEEPPIVGREPTLRHLAEAKNISIGTEYGWQSMRNPKYWQTMFGVYNTAILSNFSSTTFWRSRGDYDFVPLDRIVDWVVRNGFRARASHLLWGEYHTIPDWLLNGNFSRDEYIQILHEHISTVVGHYKGRVTEWSIANEVASRSFQPGSDFWADKIGADYVEMAFRWAREADPTGTLIFNDNDNHSLTDPTIGAVASKMLDMLSGLKGKGVPIDVVGMQMHLFLPWSSQTPPSKTDVISTMQQFANLGVQIYITEFDVNLHNITGTRDERWAFESQQYQEMVAACLESGVCRSFATWGISDADSWLTCSEGWWCLNFPDTEPLMFDGNYQPKPAYYAVYDSFASSVSPHSLASGRSGVSGR